MNIYKNFHFLNYLFLIFVLKKYGFGQTIAFLIQKILKIQTFCVKNGGKVTKHLRLGTGFVEITQYQLFCLVKHWKYYFCL